MHTCRRYVPFKFINEKLRYGHVTEEVLTLLGPGSFKHLRGTMSHNDRVEPYGVNTKRYIHKVFLKYIY